MQFLWHTPGVSKGIINRGHHKVARCENEGKYHERKGNCVYIASRVAIKNFKNSFLDFRLQSKIVCLFVQCYLLAIVHPPQLLSEPGRVVQSVLSSGFQPPNMDTFHMPCDKRLSTVAPRLLGSWRTLPPSRLFTLNSDKHCDNVPQRKSNHLHNGRIVCQLMPIPTVSVLG